MADPKESVKITFKKDEEWLKLYVFEHSSPSTWFKDLAKAEYKRLNEDKPQDKNPQENNNLFNFLD